MVKVLDSNIVVSNFELQSHYYVHFWKTVFDGIYDTQVYKMHPNFSRVNQEKSKVLILNVMKLI